MDDDKKTQSQWGQQPPPASWHPGDYPAEADATATPNDQAAAGEASPAQQPTPPGQPSPTGQPSWLPPTPTPPQTPPAQSWPPNQGWQPASPPWQGAGQGQPWQSGQPGQWPNQPWQSSPWSASSGPAASGASSRRTRLPQLLTVVAACLISFSVGMATDRVVFGPATTVVANSPTAAPTVGANEPLQGFSLYEQALQYIRQKYVGRSNLTDEQLLYGSIRGMVDALGDTGHSVFLTPAEFQASQTQLSGTIAGIGILLAPDNGAFTITKVLTGSPAAAGGVKAGDQVTAVDGVSVAGLSFDVFASKIRGPAGTKITITVVRAGAAQPINITMTRAVVSVPLVAWGMVPGTKVADISLVEFSNGASDQLKIAIDAATKAGAKYFVLDLRGNPGGYADEATDVASQFLSGGTVYITEDASGNKTSNNVNTTIAPTNLPMVVLVDHNSASAAEIVAGALQDSKRARVVGQSTFGTGTVLQTFKLSDGSAILLGTAYWLTPNGNKIFGKGITPDQQVALAPGVEPLDPTNLATMTEAQYKASADAQLFAAVKALTGK